MPTKELKQQKCLTISSGNIWKMEQVAEILIRPESGTYYIEGKLKNGEDFFTNGPLYNNTDITAENRSRPILKRKHMLSRKVTLFG